MFGTNLEDVNMELGTKKKMQSLAKQFPDVWFKDGAEFARGYEQTIWTGEGSYIGDANAFDYYGYGNTMGVHPELHKALDKQGLYAEFYDAGTVFLYNK
jgi:hypothetical protein